MMQDHPLESLEDRILGKYRLHLRRLKPLRLSGWRGFALALRDSAGTLFEPPLVEGIYSAGGRDNVKPWMDITVAEILEGRAGRRINLRQAGLMHELFQSLLAALIPPGGHLMLSYEGGQPLQRETDQALSAGVPPLLTPFGLLLFMSGFRLVKNWYLAEGGGTRDRANCGGKSLLTSRGQCAGIKRRRESCYSTSRTTRKQRYWQKLHNEFYPLWRSRMRTYAAASRTFPP
jgi:hypothetical protein